jgi:CubicO group peptidase (beta-lactamase class C family)
LAERSAEERAQSTMTLYNQIGALQPAVVTAEDANGITLTVRADKVDLWLSCAFELEEQEPQRLDQVKIMPTSAPDMRVEQAPIDWDSLAWRDLEELLDQVRASSQVPALAAAVVEGDKVIDMAVVGVREAGAPEKARTDDRFHIGSIGKSMTATMIGRLVELGMLDWNLTVGNALDEMEMRDAYRDVTLEQLLQHRAGLPGYQMFEDEEEARLNAVAGSTTERRAAFLRDVLQAEPIGPVGTMAYSNAGYVLAGYIAERASGRAWEDLMQEHVFGPMGLKHAGFDMPATRAHPEQPRGHAQEQGKYAATALDEDYPWDAFIAPAGNVHASIGGLARYASQHLEGMRGREGAVRASTFARLHALPQGADTGYAAGWMIQDSDFGIVHTHGGSAGTFFATVSLYPEHGRAVVVAMNIGPEGMQLAEDLTDALMQRAVHGPNF